MAKDVQQATKPDSSLTKLESELNQISPEILNNIPQDQRQAFLVAIKRTFTKIHSGPLPSPETLVEYNEVMPDAAERIFKEFEEQGKHRRNLEEHAIKAQLSQSNRGQNFAFIISIAFLLMSTGLVYMGHDWAGGSLGVGSLTGLVTVFVQGRGYQKKNLDEKKPK